MPGSPNKRLFNHFSPKAEDLAQRHGFSRNPAYPSNVWDRQDQSFNLDLVRITASKWCDQLNLSYYVPGNQLFVTVDRSKEANLISHVEEIGSDGHAWTERWAKEYFHFELCDTRLSRIFFFSNSFCLRRKRVKADPISAATILFSRFERTFPFLTRALDGEIDSKLVTVQTWI